MKRHAIVGTGGRAGMYVQALCETWSADNRLVALCDLSRVRMAWHNGRLQELYGHPPVPAYHADDFDRMVAETRPDVVIVATMDSAHHLYIIRAMQLGCDVICEKPMTIDDGKARAIFDTIAATGRQLRVTFNYRYAPAHSRLRELIAAGTIGRPLHVSLNWLLDTSHGADYFRRWHREKHNSGGLLVHKATHHFDLVNWWIDSWPQQVSAIGDLKFYGAANAAARGEYYSYDRYTGEPAARDDPFALFLDQDPALTSLYLDAEAETGYRRDRNVFGEPVTIEDTCCVTVRYRSGALLAYSLVAYAPWEGYRVAISGTRGRLELDVVESTKTAASKTSAEAEERHIAASKGAYRHTELRVFPHFADSWTADIPVARGGHGGADPLMLEQLFSPGPPQDPLGRGASHLDGAASILTGIAANHSIATRRPVNVDDLLQLP
ncbi:MAG: Gfo/Idh/MocA family oxidoreductase [Anaerolineaceae bacterium]|nr:Gfo/Idh/MocA family oxidoreductase [Anaerolineaceae bacterium]